VGGTGRGVGGSPPRLRPGHLVSHSGANEVTPSGGRGGGGGGSCDDDDDDDDNDGGGGGCGRGEGGGSGGDSYEEAAAVGAALPLESGRKGRKRGFLWRNGPRSGGGWPRPLTSLAPQSGSRGSEEGDLHFFSSWPQCAAPNEIQ